MSCSGIFSIGAYSSPSDTQRVSIRVRGLSLYDETLTAISAIDYRFGTLTVSKGDKHHSGNALSENLLIYYINVSIRHSSA